LSNGLLELCCICRSHTLPSLMNDRISQTDLNRRCLFYCRFQYRRRRHHVELVSSSGLAVVGLRIISRMNRKLNLLDILVGPGCYSLNPRPEVIDHVVIGDNVRDVPALTDELNVSLGSLDVPRVARFMPMRIADERISGRSNAIIRVGPGRYRLMRGDVSFGWKRSPANVFVTFPPRDPGRSPLISGNPAPSSPANIDPSAVVIGCPPKRLV
jgi:hypothetical protein